MQGGLIRTRLKILQGVIFAFYRQRAEIQNAERQIIISEARHPSVLARGSQVVTRNPYSRSEQYRSASKLKMTLKL